MDQMCKFLSIKFCDMLWDCFNCSTNEDRTALSRDIVDGPSYTIRHNYPKRLVTYDAEEIGEPRLIRMSTLTESARDLFMTNCTNNETQEIRDEIKAIKVNKVERNLQNKEHYEKCHVNNNKEKDKLVDDFLKSMFPGESLTKERLKQLDQCSKILHERFVQRQTDEGNIVSTTSMKWESLQPMHKFCFYWQALTGHVLHPTPYENFKDIFIRRYRRKCPRCSIRHLKGEVRRCWHCLKSEERVPYNLNAFLYHVSTGQVDPFDHCAVRVLLNRWR